MVEPYCVVKILQLGASIDDIVAEFFGEEEHINSHKTCFEVKTNFEGGSVIIYTICSIAIMKITKRCLAKKLPTKEERALMNGTQIEMTEKQEEDKNNTNKAEEKKTN
ncbi:hypothetical protein ENUP19_0317G0037 [Entamoeba nuttalli]|uniref:Uncharacterized protein n=1 Tax=Entamoeba nuttalli TaxID=412467 RepID=A0ABQ0DWB5_9EUKA